MASAPAPCAPATALSSSLSYHPSPAPSSSPTSSTSSQSLRKRKRDEYILTPLVISPPPSSLAENSVSTSGTMYPFQIFTSIWGTLKGLAGIATPPSFGPSEVGAPESPSKRVCVDRPSEYDDTALNDQRDKESIISASSSTPTKVSNKEAPRSQTNNNRTGLKISSPASMGRQTPPTQQLPSPLASSSEDEGEIIFKKAPRPVRSLPPKTTPAPPPISTGPLEQNELPFFTQPLPRRRNAEGMLSRALERREAFSAAQRNRFPAHMRPSVPRTKRIVLEPGSVARAMNFTFTPRTRQEIYDSKVTPRSRNDYTNWRSKRTVERRAAYSGRVEKMVKESVTKSQKMTDEFKGELVVLLKQLAATKTTGFQSLEQVMKQRKERTEAIRRMKEREAANKGKAEKVSALTREQAKLVRATYMEARRLKANNGSKTFISKYRCNIGQEEIIILHETGWLNDEIINYYMNMICERSGKPPKVAAHSSYFWTTFRKSGYKAVSRWAKRLGVEGKKMFELDCLLVPVNITKTHWLLMVVNFKEKRFEHWDSFGGSNIEESYFKPLREYMIAETQADFSDWENYKMKNAPAQTNGSDCGVFVCKTSEVIARGAPVTFSQKDMPLVRHRIIVELLQGGLLPVGCKEDDDFDSDV